MLHKPRHGGEDPARLLLWIALAMVIAAALLVWCLGWGPLLEPAMDIIFPERRP